MKSVQFFSAILLFSGAQLIANQVCKNKLETIKQLGAIANLMVEKGCYANAVVSDETGCHLLNEQFDVLVKALHASAVEPQEPSLLQAITAPVEAVVELVKKPVEELAHDPAMRGWVLLQQ